jgi:hypothetical protein
MRAQALEDLESWYGEHCWKGSADLGEAFRKAWSRVQDKLAMADLGLDVVRTNNHLQLNLRPPAGQR